MSVELLKLKQVELLEWLKTRGARVSHRNSLMKFDERSATLLLTTIADPQSGLRINDEVWIDGNNLSPGIFVNTHFYSKEADKDGAKFGNRSFKVLAFFRVTGTIGKTPFEGIFCSLLDRENNVCLGQEVGRVDISDYREDFKVMLYWTGCMTNVKDIGT